MTCSCLIVRSVIFRQIDRVFPPVPLSMSLLLPCLWLFMAWPSVSLAGPVEFPWPGGVYEVGDGNDFVGVRSSELTTAWPLVSSAGPVGFIELGDPSSVIFFVAVVE